MGTIKFFGERRYIDNVLDQKDTAREVKTLDDKPHTNPMVNFMYNSSADFLASLVDFPTRHTLITDTIYLGLHKSLAYRDEQVRLRYRQHSQFHSADAPTPVLPLDLPIKDTHDSSKISSRIESELGICLVELYSSFK